MPPSDREFYEGRWTHTARRAVSVRSLLVKKERFFLERLRDMPGGGERKVLDLGCGGGWRLFSTVGLVVGMDLSRPSLRNAGAIYGAVAVGDATALPFADESFDLIVSLDLLGHIPNPSKAVTLAEVRRVLKPGGMTLHYVEAAPDDPLTRWARRYPDEFSRYIERPEGHVGLQPPQEIFRGFRAAGLSPLAERPVYKGWLYPERVALYYDTPLGRRLWPLGQAARACRALTRWAPVRAAANLLVTLLFELCDPLLPDRWAGGVLVAYSKPAVPVADADGG